MRDKITNNNLDGVQVSARLLGNDFKNLSDDDLITLIEESDENMARVAEDTLNAVLRSGSIRHRDLPDDAREVLEKRKELREALDERRW